MQEFKFELGSEVKEVFTGFKGIIRGRSQYLTGCNTYGVQSQKLKENKPTDWLWFDEGQLILLKNKKIILEGNENKSNTFSKGGPLSKDQFAPSK